MQDRPVHQNRVANHSNSSQKRLFNQRRKKAKPPVSLLIGTGNGKQHPFSMTAALFEELLGSGRLAWAFVRAIHCNNGSLGHFVDYSGGASGAEPCSLSIVVATPYTPFHDFSLALRMSVPTSALAGILLCKVPSTVPGILRRLQAQPSTGSPLGVLTILYDEFSRRAEAWRATLDAEVVRIEQITAMTSLVPLSSDSAALNEADYERLARDMHACNTNLIFLGDLVNFELEFGAFCTSVAAVFEQLRQSAGHRALQSVSARDGFHQCLEFLMKFSRLRQHQTQALRSRIQSQTNLLYSLISQRDSRVNYIIADESRGIALAAQQDSRTMRTIAFMTLVFLPSTLVASVFSTGIFDLKAQSSDGVVAPLWWVFAIVSFLFTSVVVVAWWFWNKHASDPAVPQDKGTSA